MNRKNLVTILSAAAAVIVIVLLFFVYEKGTDNPIYEGKDFRCGIGFTKDLGGSDGHKLLLAGLNYELLKDFSEEKSLRDSIFVIRDEGYDWADSLRNGALDIVILPYEDSLPSFDGIIYSEPIDSLSVWAVGSCYSPHINEINGWIDALSASEEFIELESLFCETVNPGKDSARGLRSEYLSPYDDIFKECSRELGWDWRMLAAVAYNESRFSILSLSPKGAVGIMQVKPSSARRYGISDLLDPRENIVAGAKHFAVLQKRYRSSNFSSADRLRFTLAAYNTGSERMHRYLEAADSLSLNRYSWEDVSRLINGNATSYVDSIFATYEDICRIVDK